MKKSVLSIVAIAFAAVSVLSSCDKNDDGFGQKAKTTVSQTESKQGYDDYVITINLLNQQYKDSMGNIKTFENLPIFKSTSYTTKDKAVSDFNQEYALYLNDMQQRVNKQVEKFNNQNVVAVFVLKDSKGTVVMQKEVKPGN